MVSLGTKGLGPGVGLPEQMPVEISTWRVSIGHFNCQLNMRCNILRRRVNAIIFALHLVSPLTTLCIIWVIYIFFLILSITLRLFYIKFTAFRFITRSFLLSKNYRSICHLAILTSDFLMVYQLLAAMVSRILLITFGCVQTTLITKNFGQ